LCVQDRGTSVSLRGRQLLIAEQEERKEDTEMSKRPVNTSYGDYDYNSCLEVLACVFEIGVQASASAVVSC
jgi:hypothetical protein